MGNILKIIPKHHTWEYTVTTTVKEGDLTDLATPDYNDRIKSDNAEDKTLKLVTKFNKNAHSQTRGILEI